MLVADIARICHEANRAICVAAGDNSQLPWDEAPEWQRLSCTSGVKFRMAHPEATAAQLHAHWMEWKITDGWKYGPVKDTDRKEHPCLVPYEELPADQKVKDHVFSALVRELSQ